MSSNSNKTIRKKKLWWGRRKKTNIDDITLDDLDSYLTSEEQERLMKKSATGWSLAAELGDEVDDDEFQEAVVLKTRLFCIGKQEAELEVFLDRLVEKHEDNDRALLFVVAEMTWEPKVLRLANMLVHRGANPSAQNRHHQTPLHFAVKRNFRSVAAKLLENDALPHVRDKDKLLPLRIAMNNKNDEMAALLLKHMPNPFVRSLFTCNGNTPCEFSFHSLLRSDMQKTVLTVLDCMLESYSNCDRHRVYYHMLDADENGFPPKHPNFNRYQKSPFQHIAKQGEKSIVNHDTVRLLIRRKWDKYAKSRFQFNTFLFILTIFSLTFSAIVSVMTDDPTNYSGPLHIGRAFFELFSIVMGIQTFVTECKQLAKHKVEYFHDAFNWIDSASAITLLAVVPLRFTHSQAQWHTFAFGYLLWFLRIFKYAAVFRQLGAHAQILYRILLIDFVQFGAVFLVILVAFSGTFLLSLRGDNNLHVHNETSTFWGIMFVGIRILIEAEKVVDYTGDDGYETMSTICMVVFLFACTVIMVNILIAQLSDTYQNVQHDAQRGLEVNRAWIITKVELNSWFCFKQEYRVTHYKECEDISDIRRVLIKWDSPPLNEMNRVIQDIWDSLDNQKMNMLNVSHRIARQENTLRMMQDQLNLLVGLQTGTYDPDNLRASGRSGRPKFNLDNNENTSRGKEHWMRVKEKLKDRGLLDDIAFIDESIPEETQSLLQEPLRTSTSSYTSYHSSHRASRDEDTYC